MMKRSICIILVVLMFMALMLSGCHSGNYIDKVTKGGDKYTLTLGYDDTHHKLSGVQTIEMTNNCDNTLTAIKLHLYPSAYRQDAGYKVVPNAYMTTAYPNGISYGDITMDYVKVNSYAVAYTIEGRDSDILSVPLDTELFPNEQITIEMSYIITLPNMAHRLGYTDNTINLGNFFPILCNTVDNNYDMTPYYSVGDPFVSAMSNYDVTITAPAKYHIASTGTLESTTNTDTNTTHRYTANAVRDYALVMSDKYAVKSYATEHTTLYYYYYNDEEPDATMATILGVFNYMSKTVGKYPYASLVVAETDFCYGGMEYPQMVMISSTTSEYNTAVVHELIHQWFYGIVGNDQVANAWMDEGLTEFMTMLYLDHSMTTPLSTNIKKMYKAYTTYVDVLKHYFGDLDTSYRSLDQYKNDQDYVYTNYVKGSIMFYNIYNTMGATKFNKALSHYYNQCQGSIATPEQLINSFSHAFGTSMQPMFESYITGEELLFPTEK